MSWPSFSKRQNSILFCSSTCLMHSGVFSYSSPRLTLPQSLSALSSCFLLSLVYPPSHRFFSLNSLALLLSVFKYYFGGIFSYWYTFKWGRNWITSHAPYCFQSSSERVSAYIFGDLLMWKRGTFSDFMCSIGKTYLPAGKLGKTGASYSTILAAQQ